MVRRVCWRVRCDLRCEGGLKRLTSVGVVRVVWGAHAHRLDTSRYFLEDKP